MFQDFFSSSSTCLDLPERKNVICNSVAQARSFLGGAPHVSHKKKQMNARRKIVNKRMPKPEVHAGECRMLRMQEDANVKVANAAARIALRTWYAHSLDQADKIVRDIQIDENLELSKAFPEWKATKHIRDGYIMLMSVVNGTKTPVTMCLNYGDIHRNYGGLTFRDMHQQLRCHLSLTNKVSLRVCSYRPWYHYESKGILSYKALPSHDGQCRHLLGTTLLFYTYVHLTPDVCLEDLEEEASLS